MLGVSGRTLQQREMTTTASEITVQSQAGVHDVEALVQAAVSVLTNDMQIATHDQGQVVQDAEHGTVQLLVDTCNSNNIQERLYMCTDCNLAFYGEQGEQEWQWHLKQHKPFKCDLCSEAYEDKESLKTHVRTHSIQMPFVCDKCGSAYSLKSNLTQHMKSHEDKLYQCGECEVIFKSQANLEKHLKLHTGSLNVFACETCNKTFSQQKNLVQHMKIHQGNVGKQFKCPECPAAYSYKCHLSRHLIIHTGEKPYKCKFCGKAFNRNAHLIRHRKMHSGGEKEWKCQHCGFAFWEKGDLIRHIKSHEGNRPLKCDFCEQTFVWKRYLLKHLNNHHKADDKHFCKTCLACLPSEEELAQHEVTQHANRRPLTHKCEICQMEFHFKYKLDEHMFQHTGEKAHVCEKCPQKFVSRKDLDRHMLDHQQEVSFRCNTCEKTFSTIDELQTHVKLHTGNAKYSCSLCQASFRWKSQLTSHMVVHSADRDFKCTFCARKFKRKRDLIRHVKIYHDTKPPYTCTECNKDLHSPYNLMLHKTETHWKETDVEPGKFPCMNCTGVFGLFTDLQKHLEKVHPPRPNICLLCMKKFTLFKFLQKHFEMKHEGIEMVDGTNYEVKEEENKMQVLENVNSEKAEVLHEMDVDNIDNNQQYDITENQMAENQTIEDVTNKNESDTQSMISIAGMDQQAVASETYSAENTASSSATGMTVPIPEAITLAQFSQQGSADDIIPVFLQENNSIVQQTPQVLQEMTPVPAVSSIASNYKNIVQVLQPQMVSLSQQQLASISQSSVVSVQNVISMSQPHVVSIPQPQVMSVSQPQVVTIPQPQSTSVHQPQIVKIHPAPALQQNVSQASTPAPEANKPTVATPVKIPLINKARQGGHIVVQQGRGPNKQIKIISMDLNSMQTQSVPINQIESLPGVSLHRLEGQIVPNTLISQTEQPLVQDETGNVDHQATQ
ncbi:zinc finger protein 93-like isoform X2 [Mercenaria mercenaria]|uniref:zinc finger protein 93-like isoform X2 n=1 Tax=Mercenaria mercenaria TaxID=6596 RepID=UPI00234E9A95|nr:zinc finger protein 93-like isoform X2 [Mercenaria mercenaria]